MLIPTIIMAAIAVVLFWVAANKGGGLQWKGMEFGFRLTLATLPLLFFAFAVAGLVQVLVPKELLAKWVGEGSGWRGILIGTVAGGFAPGGPYVSLPFAAALLRGGAGTGTMVAFVTGWSLWAVSRLPMEIGIMGLRFSLIRLACTFFFPPIAGFLAIHLSRIWR